MPLTRKTHSKLSRHKEFQVVHYGALEPLQSTLNFPLGFFFSIITMPFLCLSLCLSLSDHYAYAYHRYAFSIPSLCLCLSSLSLSISKETLDPLQSTLQLWGFFLALIRWKIIIISRGTRRKKITASFLSFWRRKMLIHIHQVMQDPHLTYYSGGRG